MNLLFINQSTTPVPRKFLIRWLSIIEKQLKRRKIGEKFYKKELTLVFLNKTQARHINKNFRERNYATDVLSFEGQGEVLGELIFCSDVVKKQAKENGHSFRDEAAYLCLHGLLHLLGYDHETGGREAQRMYRLQDELYSWIDKI